MRALRFNADFEVRLSGKPPRPQLNAALEFFAFWLSERPVLVHREYPKSYLDFLATRLGRRPELVTRADAEDWWGDTTDLALMRSLSSKAEFLRWAQERWQLEARVCETLDEVRACVGAGTYLLKASDGMSGRGHTKLTRADLAQLRYSWSGPVVVEPLFERTRDVSALWIPEEERFIYYANDIDQRFQWRGTLVNRAALAVPPAGTGDWEQQLGDLRRSVLARGYAGPFSVDAFFYHTARGEVFHPGSEMNPRKTMGWLAYHFAKTTTAAWVKLALKPAVLSAPQWAAAVKLTTAQLLSPPDNRFVWYLVAGESAEQLRAREEEFLRALPAAPARGRA